MRQQERQILVATVFMVLLFAAYETVKTVLFPEMGSIGSHITTTFVVALITFLTARYVVNQQARLLLERERSNERLRVALAAAERGSKLLTSILSSVAEGLIITDRD